MPNSDCSFINGDLTRISINTCNGIVPVWSDMLLFFALESLVTVFANYKLFRLLKRFKKPILKKNLKRGTYGTLQSSNSHSKNGGTI